MSLEEDRAATAATDRTSVVVGGAVVVVCIAVVGAVAAKLVVLADPKLDDIGVDENSQRNRAEYDRTGSAWAMYRDSTILWYGPSKDNVHTLSRTAGTPDKSDQRCSTSRTPHHSPDRIRKTPCLKAEWK